MPIQNISPVISHLKLHKPGDEGLGEPIPLEGAQSENQKTFADLVSDAINSVDGLQKTADKDVKNIVMGKSDNVAEAMIAMQKAQLSFQMLLQVRNKVVQSYQELSRMQM
jgi:flagellar hook-basal body complex protein FliE